MRSAAESLYLGKDLLICGTGHEGIVYQARSRLEVSAIPIKKEAYSHRKLTIGSTRVARRAGIYVANMLTPISKREVNSNVSGS